MTIFSRHAKFQTPGLIFEFLPLSTFLAVQWSLDWVTFILKKIRSFPGTKRNCTTRLKMPELSQTAPKLKEKIKNINFLMKKQSFQFPLPLGRGCHPTPLGQ